MFFTCLLNFETFFVLLQFQCVCVLIRYNFSCSVWKLLWLTLQSLYQRLVLNGLFEGEL